MRGAVPHRRGSDQERRSRGGAQGDEAAEPELMQAAQRNIIHKNNASRKVSRLTHAIAKLAK